MSHQVSNKQFIDIAVEYQRAETNFSDILLELGNEGFDWVSISVDDYDSSLELYNVTDDAKLNEKQQKFISENGFLKCYLNHLDKTETIYNVSS